MEKAKKIKLFIGLFYLIAICLFLYFFFSKFSLQELTSYDFIRENRSYFFELKNSNLFLLSIFFLFLTILWVFPFLGFGSPVALVGGFIFGKIFKGPKLTRISPNKTIAGSLGSIILTIIALSCAIYFFTNSFSYVVVIIAIITSIACQIGDLFFSFLKRKAKIKDTGKILPGHGGVLDRLDGIIFAVPFSYLLLKFF